MPQAACNRDGVCSGQVCSGGAGAVALEWREAPPPAAATLSLLRAIATHGSTSKEGDGFTLTLTLTLALTLTHTFTLTLTLTLTLP